MRVHIVSLVFPPERGSARRIGELADSLSRAGHHVSVVTCFPNYPKGNIFPGYKNSLVSREVLANGVTVYRVFTYTSPDRQSALKRALTYVGFAFFSMLGLLRGPKPDVVYVVSPPFFLGLSGWLVSLVRRARLVLDVQDLWPDAPIALGYVRSKPAIRFLKGLERFLYNRASLILTLSETMRTRIAWRVKDPCKVRHVYNWVDLNQYAPVDGVALRSRLGLDGKFVALFAGNIGKAQGLDVVIRAALETVTNAESQFVILGDGVEKERLQALAHQLCARNVTFLDSVPEDRVPEYIGMADVVLVTLARAKHREAAIPSKLQVYMALAKPVVVAAEGATAKVVESAGCGFTASPDDPRSLACAVARVRQLSITDRTRLGHAGRSFAKQHFELKHQYATIEDFLIQALN